MHERTRVLLLGIAVALGTAPLAAVGCGGSGTNHASVSGSGGSPLVTGGTGGAGHGGAGTGGAGHGGAGTGGQKPMGCTGYPGQDPATLPGAGCCMAGPSHCVDKSTIPPALDNAFAACATGLCVPDPIIKKGSEYVPTPCTATIVGMMLPGVCLSECITLVSSNPQKSLLPKSTCGQGELCVPCTNPLDMTPTGACSITDLVCGLDGGTDAGMTDGGGGPMCPYTGPPIVNPNAFPPCSPVCGGAHCLPAALVPMAEQSQLAACPGGFCAPDTLIASAGKGLPKTCTSIAGAEGRCLSTCLPAIQAQQQLLPQDLCAPGEKCAPCFNPTAADPTAPTGACALACDKPAQPPTILTCPYSGPPIIDPAVFPACAPSCAGAHCVPASLVPMADQSQLAACPGGFCAPDSITSSAGKSVPQTCTSIAGAEGRCLSTCLPAIAAQAALLPKGGCPSGEACAPCFNPVAVNPALPTGACTLGCDKPAQPPTLLTCPWNGPPVVDPAALPACDGGGCGGAHCIPAAQVPAAVQSQLAPCNGNTGFCAPDPIISTGNNFVPASCDPFPGAGVPGRCLSTCLPAVQAKAAAGTLVQSTCAAAERCVPCNDPFDGTPTGACSLGCDKPPATPFTFPKCCDDGGGTLTGTCVPSAQVPSAQQSSVNESGNGNSSPCPASGAAYRCVPDEYLPTPYNTTPLQFCQATFFNVCGTCVSQCIVNNNLKLLGPDDCAANHKCAPCGIAPSTPGCSAFCAGGAVCGNACGCDADCATPCGVCSGGSGTCGDGSGHCDSQ